MKQTGFFKHFCTLVFFISILINLYSQEESVVTIGIIPDYGVSISKESGLPSGYIIDYFEKISQYTGWKYIYKTCTWNEGLKKLEDGSIDFFGPMQKTVDREQKYLYGNREMGYEYCVLYMPTSKVENNPEIQIDGLRIGTTPTSSFVLMMEDYCLRNDIEIEFVETETDKFQLDLNNNKFDGVLWSNLSRVEDLIPVEKIGLESFYYVTRKDNQELMDTMNNAMDSMFFDDPYYVSSLEKQYYSDNSFIVTSFTKDEKDFLSKKHFLTVGVDPNWEPVEYFSHNSKTFSGISVDIISEIARILNLQIEFVHTNSYEESIELFNEGSIDVLSCYPSTIAIDKAYSSNPILQIPILMIENKNKQSIVNQVGVSKLNSSYSKMIQSFYPDFYYKEYKDSKDLVNMMASNSINYAFVDTYVYDDFLRNTNDSKYITVNTGLTYPLILAVSKKLGSEAVSVINKAINKITKETVNTIILENTMERNYNPSLFIIIQQNLIAFLLVILIIILAFLLVYFHNRKATKIRLQRIAFEDDLTGVMTIQKFKHSVQEKLKDAKPNEYMIISMDLDNFKYINDSFGYEIGTAVITELGVYFNSNLFEDSFLCRIYAENFVFFTPCLSFDKVQEQFMKLTNDKTIKGILQNLLPEHYSLIFCAGVYPIVDTTLKVTAMIDNANIARKSTKGQHHTSHITLYSDLLNSSIEWEKYVTLTMDKALVNNEFQVFYQPKFKFSDEKCFGAEALIRWIHPTEGILSPAKFVPLFEKNGFIQKIDLFVFDQVCLFLSKWYEDGGRPLVISCNLSRVHLRNPKLVETLVSIVKKHDIPMQSIEIELTESMMHDNIQDLINTMKKLVDAGFSISIDDFGSGYSSLNILKDMPANVLKIDKEFLSNSSENIKGQKILEAIIRMAKNLSIETIAEGIETKDQAKLLKDLQCDMAQGYYYSKPINEKRFITFIKNH